MMWLSWDQMTPTEESFLFIDNKMIYYSKQLLLIFYCTIIVVSCRSPRYQTKEFQEYIDELNSIVQSSAVHSKENGEEECVADLNNECLKKTQKNQIDEYLIKHNLQLKVLNPKQRRYLIKKQSVINFGDFLSLSDCKLSQLIAYRNSPLGRSMLPAQGFLYTHRFIHESKRCKASAEGIKALQKAVQAKKDKWPLHYWNALWGGREFALFFSFAWARNHKVKKLDTQDESLFTWLGQVNRNTTLKEVGELEKKLSQIPKYSGGKALLEAEEMLSMLYHSNRLLHTLSESSLFQASPQKYCKQLEKTFRSFAKIQIKLNMRYQNLSKLQQVLSPLLRSLLSQLEEWPTIEMKYFVVKWLLPKALIDESTVNVDRQFKLKETSLLHHIQKYKSSDKGKVYPLDELKRLLLLHVQRWTELNNKTSCSRLEESLKSKH